MIEFKKYKTRKIKHKTKLQKYNYSQNKIITCINAWAASSWIKISMEFFFLPEKAAE